MKITPANKTKKMSGSPMKSSSKTTSNAGPKSTRTANNTAVRTAKPNKAGCGSGKNKMC
jgi:hypothetical protein